MSRLRLLVFALAAIAAVPTLAPAQAIVPKAYLKASNTGNLDNFGFAVAVAGDTAVVGAVSEDSAAAGVNGNQADNSLAGAGAAYVLVRSGAEWSQQAYLKASNPDAADAFGRSVAISGDTIVIGAPFEKSNAIGVNGNGSDNSAFSAGAAYVFVRNGGTWTQQAYLKASNTDVGDTFGASVAVSGDTIVVGAYRERSTATGVNGNQADNQFVDAGAAYVFVRSGTTWTQQAYLKASNTGANDQFGWSVAISGDTVVIGANAEDSSATGVNGNQVDNTLTAAGAAYVFTRSGTTWSQQAYLKASNTGGSDQFGDALAISGDTVVVGAPTEASNATGVNGNQADNSLTSAGAAYVFVRAGATWSQQAYLKASNTGAFDQFGKTVAVSGDAIVIGAFSEDGNATGVNGNGADNSASNAGAAYVFHRAGATWTQQAYLKASNTGADDNFGRSVAVSGDTAIVSADHEDSNAVGANGNANDNNATDSGAVYEFDLANHPGASAYGTGTPGCAGTQTLGVNMAPEVNSPHFAVTCDHAPASALGLGILANVPSVAGSDPLGIGVLLHVDLFASTELFGLDFLSDAAGNGVASLPIPNAPALVGATHYVMALWSWTSCSLPPFNLSTSRGLALTWLP